MFSKAESKVESKDISESKSGDNRKSKVDIINFNKFLHDIRNLIPLNHEKITAIKKFPPEDLIEIILVYDSVLNTLAEILNK